MWSELSTNGFLMGKKPKVEYWVNYLLILLCITLTWNAYRQTWPRSFPLSCCMHEVVKWDKKGRKEGMERGTVARAASNIISRDKPPPFRADCHQRQSTNRPLCSAKGCINWTLSWLFPSHLNHPDQFRGPNWHVTQNCSNCLGEILW